MAFVHLHTHTEYSLLDGSNKIKEYVARVKELGMTAAAITDHGVMYGVIDFYREAKRAGINPIIGCEVYVAPDSRFDKEAVGAGDERYYHLVLLAENDTGYANLVKIVSRGFTEGFYYKPRVDREVLWEFHEGIIALSACLAGAVPRELLAGHYEEARKQAIEYLDIFGEGNFFLELQDHGIPEQKTVNMDLIRLSRELNIPLVATNDVHYTLAEDWKAHDVLLCIQTNRKVDDEDRMRYEGGQFYVKSPEEMASIFPYALEALENTGRIADRCHVEIEFGNYKLPQYPVPDGGDAYEYLKSRCYEGLLRRYGKPVEQTDTVSGNLSPEQTHTETVNSSAEQTHTETVNASAEQVHTETVNLSAEQAHTETISKTTEESYSETEDEVANRSADLAVAPELVSRLEYELDTIRTMGFVDYFLIVWDFIKYARDNGIAVGPGRGSAAGSIVAYSLGITNIDPIRYQLLFERFLNPERVSMPDIDVDFCVDRRQEVIDYVGEKYGRDHVTQIVTFGTMAARAVIRDVARAMDLPYAFADSIAKQIPKELNITLDLALQKNPELAKMYESDERVREVLDMGRRLEGLPRNTSMHAAGVVISPKAVDEFVPLSRASDGSITTQFTMVTLEELGLLKMDFLGLRTLTVIQNAVRLVNKQITGSPSVPVKSQAADTSAQPANRTVPLDMDTIDYDDPRVYEYISTGKTEGVFQLESAGMKTFMKELAPKSMEDIIAGISLYRPGPMDFIPKYIKWKNHPEDIVYECPELEPILRPTYGCIVYQEQVMQIVRDLGGFSLGRSDNLRRAMSKKKSEVMARERQAFVYGEEDPDEITANPEPDVVQNDAEAVGIPANDSDGSTQTGNSNKNKKQNHPEGCIKKGISETAANKIYDDMIDFAKYAFNKSHAAAYAVVAYQTAYLKYYHPVEFMAALMTSFIDNPGKVAEYIYVCRQMGIEIQSPDINSGEGTFTVDNGRIRYCLSAIKNVGRPVINEIVNERRANGPYHDLKDFIDRLSDGVINKRAVENFIKAGAMDSLPGTRKQKVMVYEQLMDSASHERKNMMAGQMSLFDLLPEESKSMFDIPLPNVGEYERSVFLSMEKEVLGVYVSGHPLEEYEEEWRRTITNTTLDFALDDSTGSTRVRDNQSVIVGGIISGKTVKYTKDNKVMCFLTLEDIMGTVEIIVFPRDYEKYSRLLEEENKVYIRGRVSEEEDRDSKIIAEKIVDFENKVQELWIQFANKDEYAKNYRLLNDLTRDSEGDVQICIYVAAEKAIKRLPANKNVAADEELLDNLKSRFGSDNVRIVEKSLAVTF